MGKSADAATRLKRVMLPHTNRCHLGQYWKLTHLCLLKKTTMNGARARRTELYEASRDFLEDGSWKIKIARDSVMLWNDWTYFDRVIL